MPRLNPYQHAVAKTYGGGDYAYVAEMDELSNSALRNCGDTLFEFLMRELADDGGPMDADTAIRRLNRALEDIREAISAIGHDVPL